MALAARGVHSEREVPLTVRFRGAVVGDYRTDLLVEGKVIVESKVAGIPVGLVLNVGPRATFRRLVLTSSTAGSVVIRL